MSVHASASKGIQTYGEEPGRKEFAHTAQVVAGAQLPDREDLGPAAS